MSHAFGKEMEASEIVKPLSGGNDVLATLYVFCNSTTILAVLGPLF